LLTAIGGPLPDHGEMPADVISKLAKAVDPGIVASAGPRYFGFVTGGSLPAALAADWYSPRSRWLAWEAGARGASHATSRAA
jgi:hypothetical protein